MAHDPRTEAEKLTALKVLQLARPEKLLNGNIISFIYLMKKINFCLISS